MVHAPPSSDLWRQRPTGKHQRDRGELRGLCGRMLLQTFCFVSAVVSVVLSRLWFSGVWSGLWFAVVFCGIVLALVFCGSLRISLSCSSLLFSMCLSHVWNFLSSMRCCLDYCFLLFSVCFSWLWCSVVWSWPCFANV